MEYSYIKKNVFVKKIDYSYSRYNGYAFIDSWKEFRSKFIIRNEKRVDQSLFFEFEENDQNTKHLFKVWFWQLKNDQIVDEKVALLLKRFEVTKRIYEDYDENFRPLNKLAFETVELYLMFSFILSEVYSQTSRLPFLNGLIKINDIICSTYDLFEVKFHPHISLILEQEIQFVNALQKKINNE